jgi:Cysteine-rich CPCC
MSKKYKCPCCGCFSLSELAGHEICKVCYWHDDGQDDSNADAVWGGPNELVSLTQARENFKSFGAFDPKWVANVRKPLPEEL